MKSKSFMAGALGVLLFFAGQNVPAQEHTSFIPEQGSLPAPERASLPPPNQGSLPAPDRDFSDIPAPEGGSLPAPDGASLPPPVLPPEQPLPARDGEIQKPAGRDGTPTGSGSSPAAGNTPAAGGDQSSLSSLIGGILLSREERPERGMFWGVMAGARLPKYAIDDTHWGDKGGDDIEGKGTFNGALFFGMDFGLLAGQAEVFFAGERAATRVLTGFTYTDTDITGLSILVPLVLKLDFHWGPVVLQPLAGFYLNFALGNLKERVGSLDVEDPYANPLLGVIFGGAIGISFGRGIFFLDLRYAKDLGKTVAGNDPVTIWKRSALMLNLGYQFSLGRKG